MLINVYDRPANVLALSVLLLLLFAFLNYLGITESAFVASIIFLLHILTLTVLLGFSFAQVGVVLLMHTRVTADNGAEHGFRALHRDAWIEIY